MKKVFYQFIFSSIFASIYLLFGGLVSSASYGILSVITAAIFILFVIFDLGFFWPETSRCKERAERADLPDKIKERWVTATRQISKCISYKYLYLGILCLLCMFFPSIVYPYIIGFLIIEIAATAYTFITLKKTIKQALQITDF